MINLLLALLAGVAGFLAFYLPRIAPAWGCVLPAILIFGGAYFLLARRTGK